MDPRTVEKLERKIEKAIAGQKRKAVQYVVGNPLFALQMTQHDIRAGLYAPLRVLIYEDGQGKTCAPWRWSDRFCSVPTASATRSRCATRNTTSNKNSTSWT